MRILLVALLTSSIWAQTLVNGGRTIAGPVNYCSDTGSTDAYACSLSPAITAYVTGAIYHFRANTANTGAATLNLNGLGAKTIVKAAGGVTTALADNDIRAGQGVTVMYDGTNLQMQSTLGNASAGGGGSCVAGFGILVTGGCTISVDTSAVPTFLTTSANLNFGSIAANACAELTLTVPGAATGDAVAAAWPSTLEAGLNGMMIVTSTNTVTVRLCKITTGSVDPADQAFRATIVRSF